MSDLRRNLGKVGEDLAAKHLQEAGLTILERNWRCKAGEIDIIALDHAADYSQNGQIVPWHVVVEVRTRRGYKFGSALQSITARKQSKLREVAQYYICESGWMGAWRIDVVGVQMDNRGKLISVDHVTHAVGGE